jgi:hypothetical protein
MLNRTYRRAGGVIDAGFFVETHPEKAQAVA